MPFSRLNINEASIYLQIAIEDIKHLIKKDEIPHIKIKGEPFFIKADLKDWATYSIFKDKPKKLGKYHFSSKKIWTKLRLKHKSIIDFITLNSISIDLFARTKPSLLKELVNIAFATHLVTDKSKLLSLLIEREEQNPTGLKDGVAIPHPQIHRSTLFTESFLVIATLKGGIPFGSIDGEKSDLFFMPCASSDEEHIFILSRLASLLKKTNLKDEIKKCNTKIEILELISLLEKKLYENKS